MKSSINKRIGVATYWASTRISVLDGFERFEDSYAIAEEFREWITCIGEDQEQLETSVLTVPTNINITNIEQLNETDEILEI